MSKTEDLTDPATKVRLRLICRVWPLPDEVREDLEAAFEVIDAPPSVVPLAELPDGDALLVTGGFRLDARAIASLPQGLGAIATYSAGLEHLDLEAARARGLAVFNTSGVLAASVADATLLLILGAARRLTESADLIRTGRWTGWTACQLNGMELAGKTLGVYGMGEIGREAARRAQAFGMSIAYTNRRRLAPELEEGADFVADPLDLVAQTDVLLLAAPSTSETRGFLNARTLARAKPGIIVVNVGRGDLVVDEDLIAALNSGRVRAAGLDVFNNEPRIDARYLELPNVLALPHIGSSTVEARRGMGRRLISALQAWRRGERPDNQVV